MGVAFGLPRPVAYRTAAAAARPRHPISSPPPATSHRGTTELPNLSGSPSRRRTPSLPRAAAGDSEPCHPRGNRTMFVQLLKEFMGRKAGERIDVSDSDAKALAAQQVSDDLITPAVQKAMEQAFAG